MRLPWAVYVGYIAGSLLLRETFPFSRFDMFSQVGPQSNLVIEADGSPDNYYRFEALAGSYTGAPHGAVWPWTEREFRAYVERHEASPAAGERRRVRLEALICTAQVAAPGGPVRLDCPVIWRGTARRRW